MKTIAAKLENDVYTPSEELPQGVLTVFNGENYVVYEEGDILPEQPVYEPVEPTQDDLQAQLQDLLAQAQELINKISKGK